MTTKKVQSHTQLHQPTKLEARKPLKTAKGTTASTSGSQVQYLQYNLTEVYISH
jgi:hypothetical protein